MTTKTNILQIFHTDLMVRGLNQASSNLVNIHSTEFHLLSPRELADQI